MDYSVQSPSSPMWLAVALLCAGTPAWAASFDCKKASTPVELSLCANPELSRLDTTLGEHYRRALGKLQGTPRATLRSDQRAWLKTRDACGSNTACLQPLLSLRLIEVGKLTQPDTAELDAIIASIPEHPAEAAQGLRRFPRNELAAAWLVYLQHFEPQSGVTVQQAQEKRQQVLEALKTDSYPWEVFQDLSNDPITSPERITLTLLRMMVERAQYAVFADQRASVHCFVFSRHGADAYETFGPLYGSTRDSFAPLCAPQGELFKQPAWQQLDASVDPAIAKASGNSGTIRFWSYADWRRLALRATVSPRDFLKPVAGAEDPEPAIRSWDDEKRWSNEQRTLALAAVEPARQVTAAWLQRERGFSADEGQVAAREIVRQWLEKRLAFIGESSGE
ncbi:lysozyme inhibitor LprI family protein [Pseudomonas antarctica]|uniref:lysozyme inhibitor LprI family protein n=1 Tax=Pseudomonas antarctica TaxID=219572 RepID=UPI00387A99ED